MKEAIKGCLKIKRFLFEKYYHPGSTNSPESSYQEASEMFTNIWSIYNVSL
jgi:hypothetical protein